MTRNSAQYADEEPVHQELARAIERAFRALLASDDPEMTWTDVADEFVLALGGRVVPIARSDYDHLITSRRDARAALRALEQELVIRQSYGGP
jgi:hypothetical protein